jgi:hypothetical protein
MNYPLARTHPLAKLILDPENPRLPGDLPRRESEIVDYLTRQTAIEDLALSISENGFFFAEALVAVPLAATPNSKDITDDTPLVVVEGNRRLTALKLLQDPSLSPRKVFQKIADDADNKPVDIPVIVYESRDDVLQFLGYRHITGVKPWEPLAKARYIEQLYVRLSAHVPIADRYREVAQMVGSKPQYVRRSLNAVQALNLYRDNDKFGLELQEDEIDFSLILTALGYTEIQRFILDAPDDLENTSLFEQAQHASVERLGHIFEWLYKPTRTGTTRLVESRNIKKLADIVSSEKALKMFYEGATIDSSYISSRGSENEFREHLQDANSFLDAASRLVAFVTYSPTLDDLAQQTLTQATHIHKTIAAKKE